jgi:hypothetical protein
MSQQRNKGKVRSGIRRIIQAIKTNKNGRKKNARLKSNRQRER